MRDRDRLESELLELRAVADALDGSLRRLASGDIYQIIDMPFPRPFEGMRKDFNRGLAAVAGSIDEIISRTRELRSEAAELDHSLRHSADDSARRSATVSATSLPAASTSPPSSTMRVWISAGPVRPQARLPARHGRPAGPWKT